MIWKSFPMRLNFENKFASLSTKDNLNGNNNKKTLKCINRLIMSWNFNWIWPHNKSKPHLLMMITSGSSDRRERLWPHERSHSTLGYYTCTQMSQDKKVVMHASLLDRFSRWGKLIFTASRLWRWRDCNTNESSTWRFFRRYSIYIGLWKDGKDMIKFMNGRSRKKWKAS